MIYEELFGWHGTGMEGDDYKKYSILENILQKINQKYVALSKDETKRNNQLILPAIDRIIEKLKSKSVLFANLFETKFYGGSYYDGLKVGSPSEYDLDCLLRLPKVLEPKVEISDKPGFVHIIVNMNALAKKPDEAPKYIGLEKFLDNNRLNTKKVKSWIESLMSTVVESTMDIKTDDNDSCTVKCKVIKSGPAQTIKLEGCYKDKEFNIDVDLVPCFKFFDDNWPQGDYRKNTSEKKNTFFVVPKSPGDEFSDYWRLSFQEQEREILSGCAVMKPTIRLLKKIRDRYKHTIASYYIKTVFLWELQTMDKNLLRRSLSFIFVMMLRKYSDYIERRNIPYYWNDKNNLLADLSEITASNVCNKIRNIADHIERICNTKGDCYAVVNYLLEPHEIDMEAFKAEVPLNKKLLKLSPTKLPEVQPVTTTELPSLSAESSIASSFEEIPSTSNPDIGHLLSKVEILYTSFISEQRRMAGMMEEFLDKIESCEMQIKELTLFSEKKKKEDDERFKELTTKIDTLLKKNDSTGASSSTTNQYLDELLGISDPLRTMDLQRL